MRELLIATNNQKKLKELKALLVDLPLRITSLKDYKNMPKIEEDGKTFSQNALKKASTISIYTKKLVMGEDSGLEVKALGNRPGVFSARFSGTNATDQKNNLKLLRFLRKVPSKERQARYRCCVALTDYDGIVDIVSGSCSGFISPRSKGNNGFGYDPLFLVSRYNKTFGELDPFVKSRISHRARALKKFYLVIEKYLESHPE